MTAKEVAGHVMIGARLTRIYKLGQLQVFV